MDNVMDPLLKISHRPATRVSPEETICATVKAMVRDRTGAAAVMNSDGTLAGIFTERDLMTRVVAQHRDPETTAVGDAMTVEPVTISPETTMEQALEIMVTNHFRHLPIIDGTEVLGMATVRRVLKYKLDEEKEELESVVSFFTADGIGG
ncbi:MAG: CBS domain-containing protein [Acidobacteria bacterium]|nr:CBS domain-containing protein [Acidobacteriota bacterium]